MPVRPDPVLEPIHSRDYHVTAYRKGPDEILIRGSVEDRKPGQVYVDGDPDPLTMHYMVVDLTVTFPGLEITGAEVIFETYPQTQCPRITDHYQHLIGLSVARGFTHRVRELFGGPRGCAHVTALLQAMGPVAVQCRLSMGVTPPFEMPVTFQSDPPSAAERRAQIQGMINTCHAWAEDGDLVAMADSGEETPLPLPIGARLLALGRDPDEWRAHARARRATPDE